MGIVEKHIVNASESESQKLHRLTSAAVRESMVGDVVPWQDSWKGHSDMSVKMFIDKVRPGPRGPGVTSNI